MTENMTQYLLDQFEIMADAPGGVQRLRELILQLAVTGRLENAHLTHIGGKSGNGELDLPQDWSYQKLEDITDGIQYGFTATAIDTNTGIHLLRITDIQNNKVNWETVPYCTIGDNQVEQYLLFKGDLLIARTGGTIGKSFLVRDIPVKSIFASYLIRVKPGKLLNPEYLKLFANAPLYWFQITAKSMGTGQPNVSGTSLKSLQVPLPPLDIQQTIVEKVDTLMALCDDLEAKQTQKHTHLLRLGTGSLTALQQSNTQEELGHWWGHIRENFGLIFDCVENVEALRQTILQLAVTGRLGTRDDRDESVCKLIERIISEKEVLIKQGKLKVIKTRNQSLHNSIINIPKHWQWIRLEEIVTKVGSGSTPLGGKTAYSNTGIKFIRSQNVWNNGLFLDNVVYISEKIHQSMVGTHVQPNDVLLNITGASIGRSCIVPDNFDSGNVNQHVCIIRPIFKELSNYLNIFLISKPLQDLIMSVQVGISREGLSAKQIKEFLIPLPPLAEQYRIVKTVNHLMVRCDELDKRIEHRSKGGISLSTATIQQITGMS